MAMFLLILPFAGITYAVGDKQIMEDNNGFFEGYQLGLNSDLAKVIKNRGYDYTKLVEEVTQRSEDIDEMIRKIEDIAAEITREQDQMKDEIAKRNKTKQG